MCHPTTGALKSHACTAAPAEPPATAAAAARRSAGMPTCRRRSPAPATGSPPPEVTFLFMSCRQPKTASARSESSHATKRTSRLSSRLRSDGAERSPRFGGIAALLDRFRDVRLAALRRSRGSIDRRGIHLRCATKTTYHTVLSTRFTAEVTACQRDSSAASCFLPAAVNS